MNLWQLTRYPFIQSEILRNETIEINGLNFIGLDDYWGLYFNPLKAMSGFTRSKAKIVEHGAIAYFKFIGDALSLEGTVPFTEFITVKKDKVIIFGWVVFPSKEIRDLANKKCRQMPEFHK